MRRRRGIWKQDPKAGISGNHVNRSWETSENTDMKQIPEAVGLVGGGLVVSDQTHTPPLIIYNPFSRSVGTTDHYPESGTSTYAILADAGCFDLKPPRWTERSLSLAVTTKCNCACSYCFEGKSEVVRNMTECAARKIIDDYLRSMPDNQRPIIAFYGGEPTQNMPLIRWCVEYLRAHGHDSSFSISTNGVMGEPSLTYLLNNRFYIALSTDGPPDIQDMHRPLRTGIGSSRFVRKTLEVLVETELPFHVRATITSLSVRRFKEIVEYFCDAGVRNIHVEPVEITGACTGREALRPTVDEFIEGFLQATEVARRYGAILNTVTLRYLKCGITDFFCGTLAGHDQLYNAYGSPSLCHELLDENELSEFLSTPSSTKPACAPPSFESITNNPISPCFTCDLKYVCGGTCPKQSWEETGTHTEPSSWHCTLAKKLIPLVVSEIARSTFGE